MCSSPPRILFLSHSASRNGATILLLNLLRWLRTQVDWEIEVLVNGRGPLLDEFRSISKTTVLRNYAPFINLFPQSWRTRLQQYFTVQQMRVLLSRRRFDLIYANTSATWLQASILVKRAPALIWHIHELKYALHLSMGENWIKKVFPIATKFVAVSHSVRNTLMYEFNVPHSKIDIIHGFVPFPQLGLEEKKLRRQRVKDMLGWPEDAFVVGGCGSIGWRKGTDLFLQIAHAINRTKGYEKVRFLWVGGEIQNQESLEFSHDAYVLGLQEYCHRIPTTAEVSDFYCAIDIFALTSREDPFPLVMLEAGAHGVPVICFANSGGGPEFVGEDAGLIAPYLNNSAFADHIMTLHDEPALRERLGAAALRKVQTHYSIETQGPKLLQSIEHCLPSSQEKKSYGTGMQ